MYLLVKEYLNEDGETQISWEHFQTEEEVKTKYETESQNTENTKVSYGKLIASTSLPLS